MKIRALEQRWLFLLQNIKLGVCIYSRENFSLLFHNYTMLSLFGLENTQEHLIMTELH